MNWLRHKIAAGREQFKNPDPDVLAGAVTAGMAGRGILVGTVGVGLAAAGLWYGAIVCALFVLLDFWSGFHVLRTIVEAVQGKIAQAWMDGFTMTIADTTATAA